MYRAAWLAAALAAGSAGVLNAQGWIEIERPINRNSPPSPIVRVSSQVHTSIEGRVARVEVEEMFRNPGAGIAEGTYLYPMPGEAVFTSFSLWIGEREIRGEMMNAEQARGVYEEIVRKIRDPALLTFAGHGLVRAQVFPIQPGETRKVVLRYTQVLDRDGDALRLRYSIGQRGPVSSRGWGDRPSSGPVDAFSYRVTLPNETDYGTPYSPTHQITTRTIGGRLEISLDPDASGDMEIFLPVRRGLVGTSIVPYAPGGEDGYFMLLLAPPQSEEGAVVPRDLSLVVDVSGSMSGDKIEQAKAALLQALGTLRPEDRFRLIAFSSSVRNFRDGFTPATPDNLRGAREFVGALEADGGTNIAGALDAVLGSAVSQSRLPIIVFMTDGIPSVGEQAPDRIAEMASGRIGRARIFTVGLGHDVNTYLLDRLAKEGRGTAEYVAPEANVEVAVGSLLNKIRRPAIVNLRIAGAPVELVQSYPAALPDLFYGEELVVFGRYHGQGSGEVVIEGERNGHRERFTAQAAFPASESGNDFIPRLWASRRIGELTRQIRLEGASDDLVRQVRELGLRYGILTEYTSYLVQEPGLATGPRPIDDVRRMPALSPALQGGAGSASRQTGQAAFDRAKSSAEMSSASNLVAADKAAEPKDEERLSRDGSAAPAVKRVAGRLFTLRGQLWTDAAHSDTMRVVEIAPFSDAYFALSRALPEITPYLSVGEQVIIAGRKLSIKIAASGSTSLGAAQLSAVVKSFRGT